jgi:hypothetical protein
LSTLFTISPPVPPTPVVVSGERFTVVDAALKPQKTAVTMFEARALVEAGWQVVPEAEAAA